VGGYRVHLNCTGAGGPTVMIVGAAFSFDWALVQPEVAKFARVCTYDISGTAWSDPGPKLDCRERVHQVHELMRAAQLKSPYVLVGLSLGACVARLYAAEYPAELAGMAIVDHAFLPDPPPANDRSFAGLDTPPRLIEKTPIEVTTEDSSEFGNLPPRAQELHRWAMSLHPKSLTAEDAEDCLQELKKAAPGPYPLGDLPLVVVSTGNEAPGYSRLQTQLLALSHRSSQMKAERSFHSVEIDQPWVIVAAIRQVVRLTSVRAAPR
jgi:pimeloyl-ACP methyl ester carboxylesterase